MLPILRGALKNCKPLTANRERLQIFIVFLISLALTLTSCTETVKVSDIPDSGPPFPIDVDTIADPIPKYEPKSRGGNPESYVVFGQRYYVLPENKGFIQRGIASWYGRKFHGKKTSNGEIYDMYAMTAAHKTLPLPTYVRVTNLENNRNIVVRVNDRGPFVNDRIIDLSYVAAMKLGIHNKGTGFVEIAAITQISEYPTLPPETAKIINSSMYIQVGAFTDKDNAVRLKNSVQIADLPTIRIAEGLHQEEPVFRVQMGPIVSFDEADRLSKYLSEQGFSNIRLVME